MSKWMSGAIARGPQPASRYEANLAFKTLLGGSCVVISRVISPVIWVTILFVLLITPLITTHEPPSRSETRPLKLDPQLPHLRPLAISGIVALLTTFILSPPTLTASPNNLNSARGVSQYTV